MQVQFMGQPFSDQIGARIKQLLLQDNTRSRFLVAWGKRSGLSRLSEELRMSTERGGRVEAIVGVDEGGASIEGLASLMELSADHFVFHNPKRPVRTFHPKLYIFENDRETNVLVGSGNLTLGGLFMNYEAAVWIRVEAAETGEPRKFISQVTKYYDAFRDDREACRPLNTALLEEMASDPTLVILPESFARRSSAGEPPEGSATVQAFQASQVELLNAPPRELSVKGNNFVENDPAESIEDGNDATDDLPYITGFYKKLSGNDVSLTSSPGQIIIPIRFEEFFSPLETTQDERANGGPKKEERIFAGVFSSGREITLFSGRAILYTPAASHPRPNREIRFTFRNRQILEKLKPGTYLKFIRQGNGNLSVTHHVDSPGSADFGWLEHVSYASDTTLEGLSGHL